MYVEIATIVALVAVAVAAGVTMFERKGSTVHLGEEEKTPLGRPSLHPENGPLVGVLYGLSNAVEGNAAALRDIARTIQLHEASPVHDVMRERVARIIDEGAGVMKRGAQQVRDTAKEPA